MEGSWLSKLRQVKSVPVIDLAGLTLPLCPALFQLNLKLIK